MIVDKKDKEVKVEEPTKVEKEEKFDPVGESVKREKDVPKYRAKVVGTQHLIVRDKPNGEQIGLIGDGYVVKVFEDQNGWSKVKWGDYMDKDGYVKTEFLKDVNSKDAVKARVNGIGMGLGQ